MEQETCGDCAVMVIGVRPVVIVTVVMVTRLRGNW
jgi:hypothetical protein